jgi:hypothetical protein
LSVQITVVLPRVSAAGSLRTTAFLRHALHTDSQGYGDDRQQTLGYGGHGQGYARKGRVHDGVAAQ